MVATTQARDFDDLEFIVGFGELLEIRQQGAATVHATDDIPADGNLPLARRSASEVRVEADQSLNAIPRDTSPLGQVFEVLVGKVAVPVLQVQQFAQQLQRGSPATSGRRLGLSRVLPLGGFQWTGLAVFQCEQDVGGREVGVTFVPSRGAIDKTSIGSLQLGELVEQLQPPVMLDPRGVFDVVKIDHGQRLGEGVVVVVETLLTESGIDPDGIVLLDPAQRGLDSRVVGFYSGVDHALESLSLIHI